MEFAEHIRTPKVEDVWYYDGNSKAKCGTLCLTGHHLILYAQDVNGGEIWILYKNIDSIEKRIGIDKGTLILKCKDLRQMQLTIPGVEDAVNVASTVETLSNIVDATLQYPYFYRCKFSFDEDGWDLYCIEHQFASLESKSDRWRVSEVNAEFAVCPSYPSRVIVPKSIDDHMLQKSARFRHLGRFPILSYYHTNGAALLRSSQPLLGTGNRRSKEDEKLLNAYLGASHRGYVLDIRSSQAAAQAKTKGGGFESEYYYPRWKRVHSNLGSYYVQQESLIRIAEASSDKSGSMDRWLSKLESSNWLGHIKSALEAACLVAQCIDRQEWSVLVHGSEGMDSTMAVTSLAQIILDPECRTIRGLLTLIDREWLQGGHPFTERSSHGAFSNAKQRSEGPVFPIFLECVFQLVYQFPMSFEFTSTLLIDLRTHSYASQFGTFLFNNMRERTRSKVHTKTTSLWSYILSPDKFSTYLNPLYRRRGEVIWPTVAPQSIELWEELYIPNEAPDALIREQIQSFEVLSEELKFLKLKLSRKVAEVEGLEDGIASRENSPKKYSPLKERHAKRHHARNAIWKSPSHVDDNPTLNQKASENEPASAAVNESSPNGDLSKTLEDFEICNPSLSSPIENSTSLENDLNPGDSFHVSINRNNGNDGTQNLIDLGGFEEILPADLQRHSVGADST